MKILMALMGLEIGGAETHVVELSKALSQRGHEVLVASGGGVFESALADVGIRHFLIPLHRRDQMLRALRLLDRLIREEKPDLVHAHARIPAFLCGILQKKLGFPLITSAHWVFQVTPLLRRLTNWGDCTVAVSDDIKAYLFREYQLPADQVFTTINGIDTDRFLPTTNAAHLRKELHLDSRFIIGAVGRLDSDRALTATLLIRIMPALLHAFPDTQLLLVGGGDQEAALRKEADAVNRSAGRNVVVMTGPRTDIPDLISLMNVFAGASRAVLEAMASGIPVILSGNEGYMGPLSPDVLASSIATNFCFRGSPLPTEASLLSDLKDMLSLPAQQRAAIGQYGREIVQQHYSVARMTSDYLAAYDKLLHRKKPLHAVISGYYGYGNLGDDSILLAIHNQLVQMDPPVRLTVLSRHPKTTRTVYGLHAIARFSPVRVIHHLRRCDFLISGGGTLLQDATSTRSLLYYLGVIRLAQLFRKPVFVWANGIGPVRHNLARRWVQRCVDSCTTVTLRDQDSLAELQKMGAVRKDISIAADPALTLTASADVSDYLRRLGIPDNVPLLGVSLRNAPGMEHSIDAFAELLDRLSRETGRYIVFLVMQDPGDRAVFRMVQAKMTSPSACVSTPGKPADMLGVIGCMDAIISMRLHAIIFAARQRIPVVGCVYDPKVDAFLKALGMPSCGTPDAMNADDAFRTVCSLLEHRLDHVQQLSAAVDELESKNDLTLVLLQDMLKRQTLL